MSPSETMSDAAARRQLREQLARFHCKVHQPDDPPLFSRNPQPGMESHHWRSRELQPLLEQLGGEIELDAGGPRRTLRLTSPGLERGTTPTFWASIQIILPGEIAGAHRHSANAFRFVMEGGGATTTVDGERYEMNKGDLVLTPAWAWHDHEYEGAVPMIWLDVLDISLMHALQATFFEPYPTVRQPFAPVSDISFRQYGSGLLRPQNVVGVDSSINPLLFYPKAVAEAALLQAEEAPADPFDDIILEYQNPRNGSSAMRTMAMTLQRLRPGMRGRARRTTGSRLFYVVRGTGLSSVGNRRFDWETGDFFTVAPWDWHDIQNRSAESDAILFQVNDLPTIKALGFFREEIR